MSAASHEHTSSIRRPSLFLVLLLLLFLPGLARASGVLMPRDGSPPIHVRSHRVTATVEDGTARTTLRQTFLNPHGRMLEAIYVFPLPEGASLVDLAMEVGGKRLEGFLAERRTARRSYDALVRRRIDPALVEQIGRSTFRLSVFPVMPDELTVIELTWIEAVPMSHGEYRYVYPMAMGGAAAQTEQDLTVTVTMRSSVPIHSLHSPTEGVFARKVSDHEGRASIERMQASLNEDIVVVARVGLTEPNLATHVYRPPQGNPFFAVILTPPELLEGQVIPRDITLALDVSGSMVGVKFQQARDAGLWLVDNLRDRDRVNILLFNDTVQGFADAPVLASADNRQALKQFLREAGPGGGTALGDVVQRTSEAPKKAGRAAMAVILTDGLPTVGVTAPDQIISYARAGQTRGLRTFTFGVGQDVDAALLEGVATGGGGEAEVFRPNGEVETRLRSFLTRTASPAIVDLKMHIAGRRVNDVLPRPLPDVYLGEQAVLTGRFDGSGVQTLTVKGVLNGRPMKLSCPIDFGFEREPRKAQDPVARDLYASAKLGFLHQALRLRSGLKDDAYYKALDRGAYSTEDELISAMIDVSLATGVQCAYTSFLALLPEDRARLNPRDARALEEALARAEALRREVAGLPSPEEERKGDPVVLDTPGRPSTGGAGGGPGGPATGGATVPSSSGGAIRYTGPGDTTPPPRRGDMVGRTGPGSPRAATGGSPGAPQGAGPSAGRPTTGGGGFVRRSAGEGYERWEFWWEHNKEVEMNLRARVGGGQVVSGSTSFLTGRAARNAAVSSIRPSANDVKTIIIPELLPLLQESHPDVVDSAVLAIARSLRTEDAHLALPAIRETLRHPARTARESATLALGVLGSDEAVQDLLQLMNDTEDGRALCGRSGKVEPMIRAMAAASLGLIGDPETIAPLMHAVRDTGNPRDLKTLAILSLGLMTTGHDLIVPFLLECMQDRSLDRIARAQAPIALGKLNDLRFQPQPSAAARAALPRVVDRFDDDRTDHDLRRSLAVCIGALATMADTVALDALIKSTRHSNDDQTRHYAFASLARIGARDTDPEQHQKQHVELERFFLKELDKPRRITHTSWAAMALGEYARNESLDRAVRTRAIEALTEQFETSKNPSYKGSMAISLGLLNARSAQEVLADEFASSTDQPLKGYLAVSLGLMRATRYADQFRDTIAQPGLEFRYRLQLARALGLMGDVQAVPVLIHELQNAETLSEISSVAQALGLIGDRSAVDPLLAIVRNHQHHPVTRGFACVALGLLAEKTDQPWNAAFTSDCNYRAKVPALAEILDIL